MKIFLGKERGCKTVPNLSPKELTLSITEQGEHKSIIKKGESETSWEKICGFDEDTVKNRGILDCRRELEISWVGVALLW